MTMTRLRNAAPRALCWLQSNPQHSVPVSLLALYLGVWLIAPRHRPQAVPAPLPPPIVTVAPAQPDKAPSEPEKPPVKYTLGKTLRLRVGQDAWRIDSWLPDRYIEADDYVKFYRNHHLVLTVHAGDMHGMGLAFGKASLPSRFPIFMLESHAGCGHGCATRLYTIRRGRLIQMVEMWGENGGPIFRDYDGDGKQEWVFDDDNWYDYHDAGPEHFLVYKEQHHGRLKLWKRLPNPHHQRLPNNL